MNCRTLESCKFESNLGFNLYDVINNKEQTVLKSIKNVFEGENMKFNTVAQATESIFIFMTTGLQQKLMNWTMMIEILNMKHKDKKSIEKGT